MITISTITQRRSMNTCFEHLNLGFRYCLVFRILKLGFNRVITRFLEKRVAK